MMYRLRKLVREIHRRSVWQVLGVFLAMSWGVLNAVEFLTDFAGLPEWTPMMAMVLLLIGLPIVTATAFIQEGVPGLTDDPHEGIDPDEVVGRTPAEVHVVPEAHPMYKARLFTWRNAILGGVMAGALLVTSVVSYVTMWALGIGPVGSLVAQGILDERDPVVLAEFENRTDDASLGAVVTEALSIDLGESGIVRLVSGDMITHALVRMGRPATETLTAQTAREIAVREGIKATLEGEVSRVGSRYLVAARVVLPESGSPVASFRESAENEDDLLPAIDRLSTRLRERLGESLRTIREGAPLEQVTTRSLDALRKYTEAERLEAQGEYDTALRALGEAVALDSAFAMAHRKISVLNYNLGDRGAARRAAETALRHRERLPELERYLTEANYHNDIEGDADEVILAYERALALKPDDGTALNNLSNVLATRGRPDEAVDLLERAVAGQGASSVAHFNLGRRRLQAGDRAGALEALAEYRARYPAHIYVPWSGYLEALADFDLDGLHRAAEELAAIESPRTYPELGQRYLLAVDLHRGRVGEARDHVERQTFAGSAGLADLMGLGFTGAVLGAPSLELHVLDRAERLPLSVDAALARSDADGLALGEVVTWAAATLLAQGGHPRRGRALLAERDDGTLSWHGRRALATAALLAAEGRHDAAIGALDEAEDELRCQPCTDWVAAPIFEAVGRTEEAIARWERIRDRPMEIEMLPWARIVSAKRLAPLYEQVGDTANAIASHRALAEAWADADPELQPQVRNARERITALGG